MCNGLKITNIKLHLEIKPLGRLRAKAEITLNGALHLGDIRIYDGSTGLFVAYPVDTTSKQKGEAFRQYFYPESKELREYIETELLKAYETDQ